ncbi:hypothetical protein WICPIJ_000905 [Wickerhamomyces pijperi]|uniref:Uncharacterized protein n=1 Tax=Wickerhamomyces pijperi TaxID=599730 RepID=A0A9P8QFE5_WICPI|nr:hypothetical protein WICPIJ_000905 [Wickerhamomyces pijperi]
MENQIIKQVFQVWQFHDQFLDNSRKGFIDTVIEDTCKMEGHLNTFDTQIQQFIPDTLHDISLGIQSEIFT